MDLEKTIAENYRAIRKWFGVMVRELQTAEDLTQETFTSLSQAVQRGKTVDDPVAFLRGAARNILLGHITQKTRRKRLWQKFTLQASGSPAERTSSENEARELVWVLMEVLSPAEQDIIVRRHLAGMSMQEVADALRLPPSTVYNRYAQAMERLRAAARQRGLL